MKYPVLLCATEIAALWGGEAASAEHTLSPRGIKQRIAICFLILSFQNLGVTWLGGRCILVGALALQHMVKWRAMNVLWRRGKEQWGDLISSQHQIVYSQWSTWPMGTWGTAFSYTGDGDRVVWKWVKKRCVRVCATWVPCLYCGCVLLSTFGLSNALLCKWFLFQ